jgi:low temperature requirement protein LtrA
VFWVAGGVASGSDRYLLWTIAIAVDYSAPLCLYWLPGVAHLDPRAWQVETSHFSERFQLFVIIALGESIVVTGATTAELALTPARVAALAVAVLGTAAFWWLYFDYVAQIAQRRLELAPNRTLLARDGYTYLHVVLVAGIIVAAVGDALVIDRPGAHLSAAEVAAVVAGPILYLAGHALFRLRMAGSIARKRLAGALAVALGGLAGTAMPGLVLASWALAALVAVIVAEQIASNRRRARGEPSPLDLLEGDTASPL